MFFILLILFSFLNFQARAAPFISSHELKTDKPARNTFSSEKLGLKTPHSLSGHYTGHRYIMVREADQEKPGFQEKAELLILPDGRFRFAALQRGKAGIWTRGKVVQDRNQAHSNWDFLCEDLGGTVRGRMENNALELVWQPSPFLTEHYRFELTTIMPEFEAGHRQVLVPERSTGYGTPAFHETGPLWRAYRGRLFSGPDLKKSSGRTQTGSALIVTDVNDTMSGISLLPSSTPGSDLVLVPFSGQFQENPERRSVKLDWSIPTPAPIFEHTLISGKIHQKSGVWDGETSLGGLVQGTFRFEPIGSGRLSVEAFPGTEDSSGYYSLVTGLEQSSKEFPFSPTALFPISLSTTDSRLWVCSPDDPRFRLPIPMEHSSNGDISLNREGRSGNLFRLPSGEVGALVIRSIDSGHKAFRSKLLSRNHLWLTFDMTIQTFSVPARTLRCRVAMFLLLSDP